MARGLYLGKQVEEKGASAGARLELDPADLLTHGLIVGMTGSGKTGLAIVMLEELLLQGVPVIAIDPKGDLANLLLLFDKLDAASFEPWIDPEAARRDGKDVKTAAADTAALWKKGLAEWGLGTADIAALEKTHDAVIFTPGSHAGVPLNVLQSLEAPSASFDSAEEDLRDEIQGIVSGLLGLVHVDSDPLQSPPAVFLANLIEQAWRSSKGYSLESLIAAVADPPFDKIGALPLETAFPRRERQGLMMALNNLLASPSFASWREGEPLDVGRMLRAPDGRPRLSVVSTAHLSDDERLFVTALLLDKVKTWMRTQGGTNELRALVYMDEIFGYFPPHPANPPTKKPLLTLLKQARAQGVGVVLATQNPVDLDYKGLSNMGTWLVGTLQTDQDRERLKSGLEGAGLAPPGGQLAGLEGKAADRLLGATRKRVFLLHDVHRPAPCLLQSRWAMSYLRGPLTRDEISRLMKAKGVSLAAGAERPASPAAASAPPVLPPPFQSYFFARYSGQVAECHVLAKYAVRYKGLDETVGVQAWPLAGATAADALEAEPLQVDESKLTQQAPAGLRYGELPEWLAADGSKSVEKALRDRLPDKLAVTVYRDPGSGESSKPGETREAFAARLKTAGGGDAAERLRQKLERKKADLAAREQDVSGRKQEKWVAIGTAVLKNIGLLTGRKRTVSGVGSVLTKNRLEDTAEARLESLRVEVAGLESQLAEATEVDPARLQQEPLVPGRGGVKLLRYDLVWVY
jgi:DNA helicase HerA-like ATPase